VTLLATLALAAAVGAAPAAEPASPISILDAPAALPKFVQRPSPTEFAVAYPHGAANVGMGGQAVVHCRVVHDGRLEKCHATRESPAGAGFGGAAVSLAGFFRVDPDSDAAQSGELDLPIGFATSVDEEHLLVAGPWLEAPSFADMWAAYPDIGGGVSGQVFMHCGLKRDGGLEECKAVYQRPIDREFDLAAIKLSHSFRMRVDPSAMKSRQPMAANVFLRLAPPFGEAGKQRRIIDPVWLSSPSFARLAELFPAQAATKGVTAGTGEADCTVAADGALTDCAAFGDGEPAGLGFSQAAVKAAQDMRMSPWTGDGGPVDGARVRVPIRFTSVAR